MHSIDSIETFAYGTSKEKKWVKKKRLNEKIEQTINKLINIDDTDDVKKESIKSIIRFGISNWSLWI